MSYNCPVCISKTTTKTASKLKYLKYVEYTSNLRYMLDEMYKKDPRPNLHIELGYSSAEDSPDRFDADEYKIQFDNIKNIELDLPPDDS